MLGRVISDNGYKIEILRPIREIPFQLGALLEVTTKQQNGDLVKIFDSLIDEDTQERLLVQLRDAMSPLPEPKVSNK